MDKFENTTGHGHAELRAPEVASVPFSAFEPEAEVARTRRNLPHWQQAGVAYFVTFRLEDSLPAAKRHQWMVERKAWLSRNPEPWGEKQRQEYNREFPARMEKWLDAGEGQCVLADTGVADVVQGALHHFDGQRYVLDEYVIMPNHVHVLVAPMAPFGLSQVLHGWKGYSAHEINKRFRRTGAFWQAENFDHIVRSAEQFEVYRKYIRENPEKGRVTPGKYRVGTGMGLLLEEDSEG